MKPKFEHLGSGALSANQVKSCEERLIELGETLDKAVSENRATGTTWEQICPNTNSEPFRKYAHHLQEHPDEYLAWNNSFLNNQNDYSTIEFQGAARYENIRGRKIEKKINSELRLYDPKHILKDAGPIRLADSAALNIYKAACTLADGGNIPDQEGHRRDLIERSVGMAVQTLIRGGDITKKDVLHAARNFGNSLQSSSVNKYKAGTQLGEATHSNYGFLASKLPDMKEETNEIEITYHARVSQISEEKIRRASEHYASKLSKASIDELYEEADNLDMRNSNALFQKPIIRKELEVRRSTQKDMKEKIHNIYGKASETEKVTLKGGKSNGPRGGCC